MGSIGNENGTKKSHKGKKLLKRILLMILVLVLIAAIGIAYRYRSHIKSAYIWITTSDEDIQKNIDDAKDKQNEVLNSSGFNASKELDEALMSGKITAEQHTSVLLGEMTLEDLLKDKAESQIPPDVQTPETEDDNAAEDGVNVVPDEKQDNPAPELQPDSAGEKIPTEENAGSQPPVKDEAEKPKPPLQEQNKAQELPGNNTDNSNVSTTSDVDKKTAELVTKMYVLKSEYTGAVESIISSMKAEYSKLPAEQRTFSAKQNIATSYLGTITAMEAQCDAQVNAIVSELRELLKKNGKDTSLADTILSAYATEKENTKAYYLSTYGD